MPWRVNVQSATGHGNKSDPLGLVSGNPVFHCAILAPGTGHIEQRHLVTRCGEGLTQRSEGRADAAVAHRTDEVETGDADTERAGGPGSLTGRQGRKGRGWKPGVAGHGGFALVRASLRFFPSRTSNRWRVGRLGTSALARPSGDGRGSDWRAERGRPRCALGKPATHIVRSRFGPG